MGLKLYLLLVSRIFNDLLRKDVFILSIEQSDKSLTINKVFIT